MKLGLYGDSFVGTKNLSSWTYLLQNYYDYDTANYGYTGTGLDFSYHHFLKTHERYEKIIFVATNTHRGTIFSKLDVSGISLSDNINKLSIEGVYGIYDGCEKVSEHLSGKKPTPEIKKYIEDKINDWDMYGFSNELLKYNAMISHIKLLRPDVHFVYSFNEFDDNAFWNITKLDMDKFNTTIESNNRANHMNYKQNEQVAWYMHQWLIGAIDFNVTLSNDVIKEYYYTAQTFEESGLINA